MTRESGKHSAAEPQKKVKTQSAKGKSQNRVCVVAGLQKKTKRQRANVKRQKWVAGARVISNLKLGRARLNRQSKGSTANHPSLDHQMTR
jgi:hypothetical protein